MTILVIGGTRFSGKQFVSAAIRAGHTVTVFHRGQTGASAFEGEVERVLGERTEDLGRLSGDWDVCLDMCAYFPRHIRTLHEQVGNRIGRYVLVSTISVYADPASGSEEDTAKLCEVLDPACETVDGDTYGYLKVLCEGEAAARFGANTLIVRPGLIVGPDDPTDRFTSWPAKIAAQGSVLVPDARGRHMQFIDCRDLAAWILSAAQKELTGTFNAVGPSRPLPFETFIADCQRELNPGCEIHWAPLDWLRSRLPEPMPFALLDFLMEDGWTNISNRKAVQQGLAFRDHRETIRDTAAWFKASGELEKLKVGLPLDKEAELLREFAAYASA